jgi:hypothetical protein
MKHAIVWVLVAANVSLAGTLLWRGVQENAAHAQAATPAPAGTLEAGKYVLIPGQSTVGVSMIYVFDSANRRLGALAPDAKDTIQMMQTINLDDVFNDGANGPNSGPNNGPNSGPNNGPRPGNEPNPPRQRR